ncbi:hypothetical protein WJX72_010397 [[Myrmecia] bisecta]|uniref:NECAP PHear domain-containing protein n=1 Tax=[Myrmecia] bisecta TaxID=41462 RepID=A0AAW1PBW3_9CHLO
MMTSTEDETPRVELVTFSCKECYIYKIPPASTVGHRAELWDVDHWLQEVVLSVVTCREDCVVRLLDLKTGDLFAECPVPNDAPLATAVEPVVDSSRYFVLRVADRQAGRHAFIGIGFRERTQASDFNAALHEHLQYLRRKREAEEMREAFTAPDSESDGVATSSLKDLSLKAGETITLRLANATTPPSGAKQAKQGARLASKLAGRSPLLVPTINAVAGKDGGLVPLLSQPPSADRAFSSPRRTMSHDSMRASVERAHLMPVLSGQNSQLARPASPIAEVIGGWEAAAEVADGYQE